MSQEEWGRRAAEGEQPPGACALCGGSARVSVPHLKARPGHWATMAVVCTCPLGRDFRARNPIWMTLAEYERFRPGWREEWRAHHERLRDEAGAARAAGDLDRAMGPVLSRALANRPRPALPGPGAADPREGE